MYRERRESSFAPVNVGDELDLKIDAVGEKGDGIAKVKGFVIFIPNTKTGDEVRVKITKVLRKVGFGEVVGAGSAKSEEAETEVAEETDKTEDDSSEEENIEESEKF